MHRAGVILVLLLAALLLWRPSEPAQAHAIAPLIGETAKPDGITAALDFQGAANRWIAQPLRAIREGQGTAPLLVGLSLALLYGAVHASGPGDRKRVVVGNFPSREAPIVRGLGMGAPIAVLHVVPAIIVVVLADLVLQRTFDGAPAEVYGVRIASSSLLLGIGLLMLVSAVRGLLATVRPGGRGGARSEQGAGHGNDDPDGRLNLTGALLATSEGGLLLAGSL